MLPRVHHGTFNLDHHVNLPLKSSVSVRLNTKEKWFDIPVTGEIIEMEQIAVKVYKERFSEETYFKMEQLLAGSDCDKSQNSDEVSEVDDLANHLKGTTLLDLKPVDHWEDMASDSESESSA